MKEIDLSKIDVVILCGGRGERLREVVKDRPKPMAPIDGKPFLDILIEYFRSCGFRRFILCAGYKGEMIKEYYRGKEGSPGAVTVLVEREELGTGGAIKNAESAVNSDPFLVANGDSICKLDCRELAGFHRDKGADYSIAVAMLPEHPDGGSVGLDAEYKVTSFNEKAASGGGRHINAGVYMLSRKIFSVIGRGEKASLEHDIFPKLAGKDLYGYVTECDFTDIGTPERYGRAGKELGNAG